MTNRRIAVFDFDGTLTRRDTLVPFLIQACGRRAVGAALTRLAPGAARGRIGRGIGDLHHRDASKVALLRTLMTGRSSDWLAETGRTYARDLGGRLRTEMVPHLAWHRDQGHETVIVSASLLAYLEPFAIGDGFDHVIAVAMEAEAGRLTGELAAPNVRGPEKARRLEQWLGDDLGDATLWAYGNSGGDAELLAMADVGHWVNRPAVRAALPSWRERIESARGDDDPTDV